MWHANNTFVLAFIHSELPLLPIITTSQYTAKEEMKWEMGAEKGRRAQT